MELSNEIINCSKEWGVSSGKVSELAHELFMRNIAKDEEMFTRMLETAIMYSSGMCKKAISAEHVINTVISEFGEDSSIIDREV